MPQRGDAGGAHSDESDPLDNDAPLDPVEAALAAQSEERVDAAGARRISFTTAFLHCERHWGASWVYAPGRWREAMGDAGTLDGCVPVRVVWAYFAAMELGRALEALDTARGIGLAFGDEHQGKIAREHTIDDAFPSI